MVKMFGSGKGAGGRGWSDSVDGTTCCWVEVLRGLRAEGRVVMVAELYNCFCAAKECLDDMRPLT